MYVLGINYSGHESAVCLLRDNEIVYATAEERLSRRKLDAGFPALAIRAALAHAGIGPEDLHAVAFGMPHLRVGLPHTFSVLARGEVPRNRWYTGGAARDMVRSLRGGRGEVELLSQTLGGRALPAVRFTGHHRAHALSATAIAGYREAAVLVADGNGIRHATTIWNYDDGRLALLYEKHYPNSLGLFYSRVTQYLGFEAFSDEWKVMGLAAYGVPRFDMSPFIRVSAEDYEVNGRRLLGRDYADVSMFEPYFGPARRDDEPITDRHKDIAFAAQAAVERAFLALAARARRLTGRRSVCLSGGVAMNAKANGLLLASGVFDNVFVPPAASDEGSAFGAAVAIMGADGRYPAIPAAGVPFLGEASAEPEIESALTTYKLPFRRADDPAAEAARLIADGKIVGWFQGRGEFGARALGNRSILADPRDVASRDRVNMAVKFREAWRPFAPSVLAEEAGRYFERVAPSPYMTLTFRVRPEMAGVVPAIVHADGTARVQTVAREANPLYWRLIDEFRRLTGVAMVLNTSFNLKGDPIVTTVRDAVQTFYSSGLDALVIGPYLLEKDAAGAATAERTDAALFEVV